MVLAENDQFVGGYPVEGFGFLAAANLRFYAKVGVGFREHLQHVLYGSVVAVVAFFFACYDGEDGVLEVVKPLGIKPNPPLSTGVSTMGSLKRFPPPATGAAPFFRVAADGVVEFLKEMAGAGVRHRQNASSRSPSTW